MSTIEDELLHLARRSAPAVVAPADLAARVLGARRRHVRRRRTGAAAAVVVLGGALAAATLTGQGEFVRFQTPSAVMEPTVATGQQVVLRRDAVPQRGDVVLAVFREPQLSFTALSRVVGLPGDVVSCPDDGAGRCTAVEVDGRALSEPWLTTATTPFPAVEVPAGQVFLLGDARDAANDSRRLGPQLLADVQGAAVARVQPDGRLARLPGTPLRPLPEGSDVVDPAGPVPPSQVAPD